MSGEFPVLVPLPGGWSGETFLGEVAGQRQVVRIHARRPERAEVDAALLRLVRGLVPVPAVLEVRPSRGDLPALLITEFVGGERGDLLLPRLGDDALTLLGGRVGTIAATLSGMPMPRAGALQVGSAGDLVVRGWPDAVAATLPELVAGAPLLGLIPAERSRLAEVAQRAQARLDQVGRASLVHSDLNPKNLLIDPETLEVSAVVDWEFGHAGHPFTDLGNLLRFERQPAYHDAVLAAYAAQRDLDVRTALDLARAADLRAVIDLAGRAGQNPVADRASDLLRGIARTGDVGWTPSPAPA